MADTTRKPRQDQDAPPEQPTTEPTTGQRWKVVPAPHPTRHTRRADPRTALAIRAGRLAAATSQRLGLGSGGMIGGRLALRLQPDLLQRLAAGRRVVMVTGTNGKTTTTQMVAEALRANGEAVSNATGANMLDGHVAALLTSPEAPYAGDTRWLACALLHGPRHGHPRTLAEGSAQGEFGTSARRRRSALLARLGRPRRDHRRPAAADRRAGSPKPGHTDQEATGGQSRRGRLSPEHHALVPRRP